MYMDVCLITSLQNNIKDSCGRKMRMEMEIFSFLMKNLDFINFLPKIFSS